MTPPPTHPEPPYAETPIPACRLPQTILGTPANPRPNPWLALAASLLFTYAVAALGALATAGAIPTWYAHLNKPPLTPPNWLFAPVWTLLYTAMAIAAWLAWRTRNSTCRRRGLRLYAVQLLFNLCWSWTFFTAHRPGLALIDIALLSIAIALTAQSFFRMSHTAGRLLLPYLAWVAFAAYLNWGIWHLNP